MIKKRKLGFSILDAVLLLLILACVLSTVFQEQIRLFLGETEKNQIEVTFLVEKVTSEARNHPVSGEEAILADTKEFLGTISSVSENKNVYVNVSDSEDTMEVMTLTCKLQAVATEEQNGYRVAGHFIKPGVSLAVETPSASFVMIVTMVKPVENQVVSGG